MATVKHFDEVGFIISFEQGDLTAEQAIEGIQSLIDSGTIWHLQGSYQRLAHRLIDHGLCTGPRR